MRKYSYYKPSETLDFARYIDSTSSSRSLMTYLYNIYRGAYNIYNSKSPKKVSYSRYISRPRLTRNTKLSRLVRLIKQNLATIEISVGSIGLFVLLLGRVA